MPFSINLEGTQVFTVVYNKLNKDKTLNSSSMSDCIT